MAGIVFWFESFDKDVFSSRPTIDLDAWRYAAKAGGVDSMRCLNTSFVTLEGGIPDFAIIGASVEDFTNWMNENATANTVIFDTEWSLPDAGTSLKDIDHSTVDWYVFGSADGISHDFSQCQYAYLPQCGMGALHSVHIASAVMLRRWESLN